MTHALPEGHEPTDSKRPLFPRDPARVIRSHRAPRGDRITTGMLRRGVAVMLGILALLAVSATVVLTGTATPPAGAAGDPTNPPGLAGAAADAPATDATASTDSPATPAQPPPVPTYTGVGGESCPQTSTAGYYNHGWSTDWYSGTGGWTADGCTGGSIHVPMSGNDTSDDLDNVVVWWFLTGPVSQGSCAVSMYVPKTANPLDDAGAPATYAVFESKSMTGTPVATLTVDQTTSQGKWASAGTVTVTDGQLAIRLMTRGIDWGDGRDGAHLGVSAAKVACTAT